MTSYLNSESSPLSRRRSARTFCVAIAWCLELSFSGSIVVFVCKVIREYGKVVAQWKGCFANSPASYRSLSGPSRPKLRGRSRDTLWTLRSRGPKGPGDTQSDTPQRAQRSKKFDLDRNFQSRSKFLISLEHFNLDVSISPQKIGPRWVARSKISFSIEIFNLDRNLEFF